MRTEIAAAAESLPLSEIAEANRGCVHTLLKAAFAGRIHQHRVREDTHILGRLAGEIGATGLDSEDLIHVRSGDAANRHEMYSLCSQRK